MKSNSQVWPILLTIRSRVIDFVKTARQPQFLNEIQFVPHFDSVVQPSLDVYVFYTTENELKNAQHDGTSRLVETRILEDLDASDVGKLAGVEVRIEFDSDENVTKNYQGNYYLRLL
jgi:hypothetical protein